MRGFRTAGLAALCATVLACLPASAAAQNGHVPSAADRYTLANGCFNLSGGLTAESIRMQATDLGRYLLYGKDRDFVTGATAGVAQRASSPSESAEWNVTEEGTGFKLTNVGSGQSLTATFAPGSGCADYPEAQVNASGNPYTGATPYGEARGFVDAHLHAMAFEFIGGSIRCGRPWHPYGVTHAMVDCPDHGPGGAGAAAEGVLSYGNPVAPHDTVGWPTFKDWPAYRSLTHEQVYWKGLERAWRGGLRVFVNLMVDNAQLCEVYPLKRNPCNEMNTVRLEIQRIRELERYIDAQNGGPGKGWFRIVKDPFEARRVINSGKLAVVLGMEVSKPFDCDVQNDQPACDRTVITEWLNELETAGLRQFELVNKFDNALVGVAGDSGSTGLITSTGNKGETGNFFDYDDCKDEHSDRTPATQAPDHNTDRLFEIYAQYAPGGLLPVYGNGPQCNKRGLTDLGEFAIRELMRRKMLVDPDHMSVLGRRQSLALLESQDYSGVVSSHSWSTDDAYPRIARAGGFNAPYAGSSEGFVRQWQDLVKTAKPARYRFGIGYGADMNGFGGQGPPRGDDKPNKVQYPFKSWDGGTTLDKQIWGERTWNINTDGVAHYGLYPDWVEDLRKLAGDGIVRDLAMGTEAYLQTWERANGIRGPGCRSAHEGFAKAGNELGRVRLGASPEGALRSTQQPVTRNGRVFRWCVGDKGDRIGEIRAVFTSAERVGLVTSTAPRHRYDGVGRGSRTSRLRGVTRVAAGLYAKRVRGGNRIVYGTKRGKVTFAGLATRAIGSNRAELLRQLKLAGVR
jgi:microsomal dipeptidase-like Zn-dependent dipeptidase